MAQDLGLQARDFDLDFIRVSCHALATSVRDEALGWVKAISQSMRDLDQAALSGLKEKIFKYNTAIHVKPVTLDELKAVSIAVVTEALYLFASYIACHT